MLAPYQWLKDYVKIEEDPKTLADRMVMTGNGVEGISNAGDAISGVIVGEIRQLEKHPDADKLQICQIDIGAEELLQIVTGADNVFVGAKVPVAMVGANLAGGVRIKKGKLRGVLSMGMLCSGEELGITEEDFPGAGVYGILILPEECQPGEDVKKIVGIDEPVIEFEVGANRPDCLSILGIAREAAAALDTDIHIPKPEFKEAEGNVTEYVGVSVQAPDLCPRYIARAIKNVKIGPSPQWMARRLKAAGVRPINNIVDITNFVMLETGQPMHAFDAKDIRGGHITVRRAQMGETMVTLDEKERTFTDSMLLITDEEGPIAIAGVMGGLNSEIKEDTTTVIFESAKFMYGSVRQTSRNLGMATESSMRFSKGVDAGTTEYAMQRACQLVEMLGAGEVVGGQIDILEEDLTPKIVTVPAARINELLGTEIPAEEMRDILNRVFIKTTLENGILTCEIPHFRGDIEGGADIAEEVARIYGYDNITVDTLPGRVRQGIKSEYEEALDKAKSYLVDSGFFEAVTYSFTGEAMMDKINLPKDSPLRCAVPIINPLGDDTALMRTTLVPDMLTVMANNINRKNTELKLFELNRTYHPKQLPVKEIPEERRTLILGASGAEMDFYVMKGYIENLARVFRIADLEVAAGGEDYYHPGRKAVIYAGGEMIGSMGEIHPDVAENFGVSAKMYLAQVDFEALIRLSGSEPVFRALPKFPASERDLAVIVDTDTEAGAVLKCIRKNGGKLLAQAELFDVYEGAQLGEHKKSLAYALTFRSAERTLKDKEVNAAVERMVRALEQEFGAELRK